MYDRWRGAWLLISWLSFTALNQRINFYCLHLNYLVQVYSVLEHAVVSSVSISFTVNETIKRFLEKKKKKISSAAAINLTCWITRARCNLLLDFRWVLWGVTLRLLRRNNNLTVTSFGINWRRVVNDFKALLGGKLFTCVERWNSFVCGWQKSFLRNDKWHFLARLPRPLERLKPQKSGRWTRHSNETECGTGSVINFMWSDDKWCEVICWIVWHDEQFIVSCLVLLEDVSRTPIFAIFTKQFSVWNQK